MPSPFPGMDPFIEGQVWRDFHNDFIIALRAALMPQLRPRYIALVEERVYLQHSNGLPSRSIVPDIGLVEDTAITRSHSSGGTAVIEKPVSIPIAMPEEVKETYLEVRLKETNELVTVLEVLSPTNKIPNSEGRAEYLLKRAGILRSKVNLVEIDLLRGGIRMPMAEPLPSGEYYIIVSRASERPLTDVWPIGLKRPLPAVSVPLSQGDPDASLDLQAAFQISYDRAAYDALLDYRRALQPPLGMEDATWVEAMMAGLEHGAPQLPSA